LIRGWAKELDRFVACERRSRRTPFCFWRTSEKKDDLQN
jgi:hypothetical protein